MSREVRRVPRGWKHPVEYNPHWEFQSRPFLGRVRPPSRLHAFDEQFVGLRDDYPNAIERWLGELADVQQRRGHDWTFSVEYHLTGFPGRDDDEPIAHPFYIWTDDDTETAVTVRDEDHLHELLLAKTESERPNPADYMPVWDEGTVLGWCLYETVSEGTPCTPVFATAEELIGHLATVGQDYDQIPMRREAAEALVRQGHSFGSMVVTGGKLYNSTTDADKLAQALEAGKS